MLSQAQFYQRVECLQNRDRLRQAYSRERLFVMDRGNYTTLRDLPLPESQAMPRPRMRKLFEPSRERMFLDDA